MKSLLKFMAVALFVVSPTLPAFSQVVYQHVDNTAIYEFLDEMANLKIIELNSAIKPYSRIFIAKKLGVATTHADLGIINEGALAWSPKSGILWMGKANKAPSTFKRGVKKVSLKNNNSKFDFEN